MRCFTRHCPGLDLTDAELALRLTLDLGVAGKVTQGRPSVTQQLHTPMIGAQTDKAAGFGPSVCRSVTGTVPFQGTWPVTTHAALGEAPVTPREMRL